VAIGAWLFSRSILHPAVVTCGIWAILLVLYPIFGSGLNPLSNHIYKAILLWSLTLSVTSIIVSHKQPINFSYLDTSPNKIVVDKLIPIMIICLSIGILATIARGMAYDSNNIFHGIREASIADMYGRKELVSHNAIVSLILAICGAITIPLCMSLWFYGDRPIQIKTVIVCLLAFVFIFIRSNKTIIAQAGLSILCLMWMQNKVSKWKIFGAAAGVMLLLLITHMIRRIDSIDSFNISNFISLYLLSPLPAFDYLLNMSGDYVETFHGEFTFRSFTRITQLIDPTMIGNSDPHCLYRWVAVPMNINVYTCMMPFYEDFGIVGIGIFGCVYGLVAGYLFRGMQQGVAACTLLYCNLFYILVFQFFSESGMMFIGTQLLLAIGIFCLCFKQPNSQQCVHK